ncbi:MAG: ABC transporter permease, partial [Muribaculaceae bacterium]|nr:ABC transporter permease [Muribaculaceae bacterium]
PLGYDPANVIVLPYQFTSDHSSDGKHFKDELLKLSCVDKVSFSCGHPHSRGNNNTVSYEGRTISFQNFVSDTTFMDLLGLKLKRDNHIASQVKHYLNDRSLNELGLKEDADSYPDYDRKVPIAGIVDDFMIGNILTDQHPLIVATATPFENFTPWNVLIKIHGDKEEALRQVRGVFEDIYTSNLSDSVFEMPFLTQQIEDDFDAEHRLSVILTWFALIAIMISMLGLMAMSTYYVRQRAQDIAVHKVMGGTSMEVLTKLVRTFMAYVLVAAVISIPVIYYVMNDWLSQFSYRINVYWWIYVVSALLAVTICFLSVVTQCSRAANTNPINSLK